MIRKLDRERRGPWAARMIGALLAGVALPALAASPMLTGQVRVLDAEAIFVPPSDSSPVVLRYLIAEGSTVKPGDVLVRIDPGQSLSQAQEMEGQIEQAQARRDKDLAELEVKVIDAKIALTQARAVRDKAQVDAQIPRDHLSALDSDRYAGEYERAKREHDLKAEDLTAAEAAVVRRRADAALELRKLEAQLGFHQLRIEAAEQRATREGTVRHGFDPHQGQRYAEGMSVFPGNQIGEVAGRGAVGVRAFALEPERSHLSIGQAVTLYVDAFSDVVTTGRINRISGVPEPKAEWGDGRYFEVDIVLDDAALSSRLLSGMSVRVEASEPAGDVVAGAAP